MCGIVGVLGKVPGKDKIEKARDALKHRGPDDKGMYYCKEENIALGHRRLSIIDLSAAGHQPFFSNDKRYIIVYNGEIYNYLELKEELKNFYSFKTKTDTEVLLAAYMKWDAGCLNKFNGMFAFAIWDRRKKRLFCARDRLGIKPFFYCIKNNTFAFASEIKALLALGAERKANEDVIYDYLRYGLYDHSDETFFQGIKKLSAGSYLIFKDNQISIKKYWDLANTSYDFLKLTSVKIREKFEQLIADSIKLRFRSDVPVGINLSSGLDSNSMLYYTNNIIGTNVTMFTMCTISDEYNECALLEKSLNNQQKQYWHTCFVDHNEIFLQAEKMNFIQDQPFGGIPTIAYSELIKTAQQHNTTVLLEGQGLDELLAGYKYYLVEHLKDLKQANNKQQHLHYSQDMSKLIYIDILDKDFINAKQSRQLFFKSSFKSNLLNAQYRDIVYTKIPRVLRFNDHVTMHYGRELRLPYLDHRIVEFCFHLPAEYKINQDLQKVLMRELMEDKLPNIMRNNPKKTFGAVQTEWLRKYYKEQAMALLNSESFKQRGYWNLKLLKNKVDNFYKGEGNNSFFIWQCFNLEMWFKSYID